jgi:hypothetical protein
LTEPECADLAEALAEVNRHYGINPLSDKQMAIIGLVFVAGRVYGPRVGYVLRPRPKPPAPGPDALATPASPELAREPGTATALDPSSMPNSWFPPAGEAGIG